MVTTKSSLKEFKVSKLEGKTPWLAMSTRTPAVPDDFPHFAAWYLGLSIAHAAALKKMLQGFNSNCILCKYTCRILQPFVYICIIDGVFFCALYSLNS